MTRYGYQCDTCELDHLAQFDSESEATEWATEWADAGFKVWQVA
jgi:hypothetical protein